MRSERVPELQRTQGVDVSGGVGFPADFRGPALVTGEVYSGVGNREGKYLKTYFTGNGTFF